MQAVINCTFCSIHVVFALMKGKIMDKNKEIIATCAAGLELLLKDELIVFGGKEIM